MPMSKRDKNLVFGQFVSHRHFPLILNHRLPKNCVNILDAHVEFGKIILIHLVGFEAQMIYIVRWFYLESYNWWLL